MSARARFEVRRRLGAGGMGVVYSAFDHERGIPVALKTIRVAAGAQGVARLKREFRLVAGIGHPNLLKLYELVMVGEDLCISMELIEGTNVIRHLDQRSSGRPTTTGATEIGGPPIGDGARAVTVVPDTSQAGRSGSSSGRGAPTSLDYERVRIVFRDLASAISALHAAGRLHRDIKPSNVLVTNDDRVVLCDFGLIAQLDALPLAGGHDSAGTPGYMSPEQAAGKTQTEASDWYGVGCLLHNVLCGHAPTNGPTLEEAVAAPPDLVELCRSLLAVDPGARPTGPAVLRALGAAGPAPAPPRTPFVGREAELDAIASALEASRSEPTILVIAGESGIGKSALIREALNRASAVGALALSSRCHVRDSVPYKAIDPWIEDLAFYLESIPRGKLEPWLSDETGSLTKLFPILNRIEPMARAGATTVDAIEPRESRRRGVRALRTLLHHVAAEQPIVLACDDFQWADADSVALLSQFFATSPPPLLLLVATRPEASTTTLERILSSELISSPPQIRHLTLGPLDERDIEALVRSVASHASAPPLATILEESQGRPYFAEQMALDHDRRLEETPFRDVMLERLNGLGADAVRMFEHVLAAGHPVSQRVLTRASGVPADRVFASLLALESTRFLKQTFGDDTEALLEPYHDRLRSLAPPAPTDERGIHRRFAEVLEEEREISPEVLADHWARAGDDARARLHALEAAKRAAELLAFDQAARFYRMAIDLDPNATTEDIRIALADALTNAGHRTEAADAYLDAAKHARAPVARRARQRAAEELLRNGHLERGRAVLDEVLAEYGLALPRSLPRAVLALGWERARVRLRGLDYAPRGEDEIAPEVLDEIDACWSASSGLGFIDTLPSAVLQARGLRLALSAGESRRLVRTLASEGVNLAAVGQTALGRVEALHRKAAAVVDSNRTPYTTAFLAAARGMVRLLLGDYRGAHVLLEEGWRKFRDECTGVWWELRATELFCLMSLVQLGRYDEAMRRASDSLEDAMRNGDLFTETNIRTRMCDLILARDRPAEARAQVTEAVERWKFDGVHIQHWFLMMAETNIDLYEGRTDSALERLRGGERSMKGSLFSRVQSMRLRFAGVYINAATANRSTAPDELAKRAALLRGERLGLAFAYADLADATAAALRGDTRGAIERYRRAASGFEELGACVSAWSSLLRASELSGDPPPTTFEGLTQIVDHRRFARVFAAPTARM